MKRFRFSLATVLKLRERTDRDARTRVARASAEVARLHARASLLDAARAWAERESASTAKHRGLAGAYLASLQSWRRDLAGEIGRATQRLGVERAAWVKAHRARKSLERLRDIRHEAWVLQAGKVEQAEIEEVAALGRRHRAVGSAGKRAESGRAAQRILARGEGPDPQKHRRVQE